MENLRECPFCGKKDALHIDAYQCGGVWWFYVECQECMANGPVGKQKYMAVDAWNQRREE